MMYDVLWIMDYVLNICIYFLFSTLAFIFYFYIYWETKKRQ